jgi:hypothetical protein
MLCGDWSIRLCMASTTVPVTVQDEALFDRGHVAGEPAESYRRRLRATLQAMVQTLRTSDDQICARPPLAEAQSRIPA